MTRIGLLYDRELPPEGLPAFARAVEEAGADDLWVVEDLGWAASISAATMALAATERLRVGIGIAPVPLRNPALLAMELATIARVYPGRLVAGLGHGVGEWMRQVGAEPARKLAALEENIQAVRGLLQGETVTLAGREVTIDKVRLVHAPEQPPALVTGVVGPRSLELSGRVADGTILPEGVGPEKLAEARTHITKGITKGTAKGTATGDRPAHELIVFTFLYLGGDAAEATGEAVAAQAAWLGVEPSQFFSAIGPDGSVPGIVSALSEAGCDTVVLRPLGDDPIGQARAALKALGR
jgi:5,10-methylenetetrahydromethanopterin reductase